MLQRFFRMEWPNKELWGICTSRISSEASENAKGNPESCLSVLLLHSVSRDVAAAPITRLMTLAYSDVPR